MCLLHLLVPIIFIPENVINIQDIVTVLVVISVILNPFAWFS